MAKTRSSYQMSLIKIKTCLIEKRSFSIFYEISYQWKTSGRNFFNGLKGQNKTFLKRVLFNYLFQ